MVETYLPKVNVAKELSEISKDFTNPRELARETIANSLDASASKILIEAFKDDSRGADELVIRISDDGVGMSRTELESFFDLGFSNKPKKQDTIGNKGHGTKITYNSSCVTVFTKSLVGGQSYKAVLDNPKRALNLATQKNAGPPKVEIEKLEQSPHPLLIESASGTVIEVREYDGNNWAHLPMEH